MQLPLVATFKLLHISMFVLLHAILYEGLRFQFVLFKKAYGFIYDSLVLYYVQFSLSRLIPSSGLSSPSC